MKMKFSTIFTLFAIETISQVGARQFTWLLSTSYNATKNWSKGRLPCSTDTVIFPKDMRLTVELPEDHLEMKEIVLPRNGEIVFPKKGSISISSQNRIDGSCDGGTNSWTRDVPGKWLSPESWSGPSPACPDLERVPCPTDSVVFPSGSTYVVLLPPFEVPISSVTIKGTRLVGDAWDQFLLSPEGDRQFANGPLKSSGEECEDLGGCECSAELLHRWICPTVTCPFPACLEPVLPLGDCCLKCGAYLLYKFSAATQISKVEAVVKREMATEDVYWHVGRTMGYIQVVLVEKEYSAVTADLAKKLDLLLLSSGLGLKTSKLEASGPAVYPGGPGRSMLIFFLSLLIAVAFFTFLVVYYQGGMPSILELFSGTEEGRFAFARFENQSGAVELGSPAVSTTQPPEESGTREFANPMFSEGQGVTVKRKLIPTRLDNEELNSSSENTSLSDAETEIILGIPNQKDFDEVETAQLLG